MHDKVPKRRVSKWFLIVLSPVLIIAGLVFLVLLLPFYLMFRAAYWVVLRAWFELTLGFSGRRILLVYSSSPNWQEHIESYWLPRLEPHVIVVNWSERSTWGHWAPLPVRLFRFYAGEHDFNPMVVLFPRARRARVLRLLRAFRDFKHGKPTRLDEAERQVFEFRETLGSRGA